jgi:hypothetical protein
MDSTVRRRVAGTPLRNGLNPPAPSPAAPSKSAPPTSARSKPAQSKPAPAMSAASEVLRAPAHPERSGQHPRAGCKARPP